MNLSEYFKINRHRLANGLTLLLVEKKEAEIISLNLAYKVGSKNEIKGKTGMAHLFEHLMFEGSKHLKKGEFDKICSLAGGTNNAYTGYDYTAYVMTLPSNQLETALWLESDRMLEFAVSEEAMETQKKVVSEEIRQTVFDRPYGKWRELLARNAYTEDCPYSWEVHGSIEDVLSVDLSYLEDFFYTFYRPANAVLTICGNFDSLKALDLVEKYFGNIGNKTNNTNRPKFNRKMLKYGTYASFEDAVPLPATFINFHIPGMLDDRILIANVISYIATHGRSSRIYSKLVEDKQIASTVGSYIDDREYSSLLTFYAITNNPEIELNSLKEEFLELIHQFNEKPVSETELNRAVNQLTLQVANQIQYSSGLADVISSEMLFTDDLNRIYNILERYKKITSEDVMKFANEFLDHNTEIIIDCLPAENK